MEKIIHRVLKQFPQLNWSSEHISLLIREFERFLELASLHADYAVKPPEHIALIWSATILETKYYRSMCENLFGKYINYSIEEFSTGETDDYTVNLYRNTFNEEPPHSIWKHLRCAMCYSRVQGHTFRVCCINHVCYSCATKSSVCNCCQSQLRWKMQFMCKYIFKTTPFGIEVDIYSYTFRMLFEQIAAVIQEYNPKQTLLNCKFVANNMMFTTSEYDIPFYSLGLRTSVLIHIVPVFEPLPEQMHEALPEPMHEALLEDQFIEV